MATVDSLDIQISAQANNAISSIERLTSNLEKLSASLNKINGSGLTGLANGVSRLGTAMQSMNNVKTTDFTRLAKNIEKLGNINTAGLNSAASSLSQITRALNNVGSVSSNSEKIAELSSAISRLGYKSATKAIENIPQLAIGMKNLMQTLSTAPRVSQNLIQMTNALANFAHQGSRIGSTSKSLISGLNGYSSSANRAAKSSHSLAAAFGKFYANWWLIISAAGKLKDAIDLSSNLTEVQNVVNTTFDGMAYKIEEFSKTSIIDFGMSELTAKTIASRFQAMGNAMGIAQGKMSDMSVTLTALSADMASFYNEGQEDVAKSLQSIFSGETEPLRKYGLDLTNATLSEWALNNGLNANIKTMTQAEKTLLRYQYVIANTTDAQGDFARTSGRLCAA